MMLRYFDIKTNEITIYTGYSRHTTVQSSCGQTYEATNFQRQRLSFKSESIGIRRHAEGKGA